MSRNPFFLFDFQPVGHSGHNPTPKQEKEAFAQPCALAFHKAVRQEPVAISTFIGKLLDALIKRDGDELWAVWWEGDVTKGNMRGPAARLARLLKPFGVIVSKGYKRTSFEDAFSRYLP